MAATAPPIRRQFGGGALAYLAALSESAQADLQVVPFSALIHPVPDLGALSILRFGQAPVGVGVACLPGAAAGQFLTGDDASACVRDWEQLRACALTPDDSATLLHQRAAA